MAYEAPGFSFPLPAGADFSAAAQFRAVDVSSTGKAINPTAGAGIVGIRQNRPPLGGATTIVQSGIVFVECSAAITAGAQLKVDANGCVLTATSGTCVVGRALETTTASGQQLAVLLIPNAPVPA